MGTKLCLSATCRRFKGIVEQMQLVEVSLFTLGFPAESRLVVKFG